MHFTTALVLFGMLQAATPAFASSSCAADNCLRAIRASAFPTRPGTADCSSYFMVTVTPEATTTITVSPTSIPAYASACSGSVRYSSACSCIGVTQITTTAPAPTPTCGAGSTCASLSSCDSDCFCFETSDDTGFCGPNVSCGPLADCTSSSDCSEAEVCAVGTCCGRNVCLGTCASNMRRSLLVGHNVTEPSTGGQGVA